MLSIDREAGPATAIAAIPAALALAARRPGLATVLAALPAGPATDALSMMCDVVVDRSA